jgi:SPX domain protein involved in polyphosphate accumulation
MSESLSGVLNELITQYYIEPRIERKFIVRKSHQFQADRLINFHPLRFQPAYKPRQINNLYMDTPAFKYYFDSIAGLTRRIKLRIRWYGNLFNKNAEPRLEIKLKNNMYVYKLNFRLGTGDFSSHSLPETFMELLHISELPDMVRDILPCLRPVLINSYNRQYWHADHSAIRLTMDEDLRYFAFHRCTDSLLFSVEHDNHTVLEVKNHPDQDNEIKELMDDFLPRISRYSKYTNGVDLLFHQQTLTD